MNTNPKYDNHSFIHNFFFHPFHQKEKHRTKTVLAVITNIFITLATGGLWQIPFWVVNRLDYKKFKVLSKEKTNEINKASQSTGVFPTQTPSTPPPQPPKESSASTTDSTTPQTTDSTTPPQTTDTSPPSVNEIGETTVTPPEVPPFAFGAEKWKTYFGVDVDVEPPLPQNINATLSKECPIFKDGRTVGETHLLVLVPEKVNGIDLTFEKLEAMVKTPQGGGHPCGFRAAVPYFKSKAPKTSHWVLITKDVVPDSRKKDADEQKRLIRQIVGETSLPYTMPHAFDVAVSLLMHYVSKGEQLFIDHPTDPSTYTRCQDMNVSNENATVGGFNSAGLRIITRSYSSDDVGVAAERVLS